MGFAQTAQRLAARALRVLGNEVTIGDVTGRGQLNAPMERVIDGMAIMTGWELEYLRADFLEIHRGDVIEVDGVTYQAREDGLIKGDQATAMVQLQPLGDAPPFVPVTERVEIEINGDFL